VKTSLYFLSQFIKSIKMAKKQTRKQRKILQSRSYIHEECGEETEVSGSEFEVMSNPFAEMVQTQCSYCEEMDSIFAFSWADTGESLPDYYERHRKNIPEEELEKTSYAAVIRSAVVGGVIGAVFALILGGILGATVGLWTGIISGVIALVVFGALGAIINFSRHETRVVKPLVKKYLKVDDTRRLR